MPFVVVDRLAEYRDCGADFSAAIFGFDRYPVSKPIAAALLFLGSSRVRFWYAAMVCYRTGFRRGYRSVGFTADFSPPPQYHRRFSKAPPDAIRHQHGVRSEERRLGKECSGT